MIETMSIKYACHATASEADETPALRHLLLNAYVSFLHVAIARSARNMEGTDELGHQPERSAGTLLTVA